MFSERLRNTREKLGLTQRELNRRCGFAEHTIYQYEAGRTVPSTEHIKTLAAQLKVSTDYLLGVTLDPSNDCELSEEERDMLDIFRREGWRGVVHLGVDRIAK